MPSNKINPKEFLTSYLDHFSDLVKPDEKIIDQLGKVAMEISMQLSLLLVLQMRTLYASLEI